MIHTCKNCEHKFSGKYCNFCGQPPNTSRLTIHYVWHDLQSNFIYFEKGILFTLRQLFTRPGYAIRDFINGKRVQHIKPFSFLLLMAGIYGFLYHYLGINYISLIGSNKSYAFLDTDKANNWLGENYAVAQLIYLPIRSLVSWFVFKKFKYNYIEHLVLNAFLFGQRIFLGVLLFPVLSAFNGTPKIIIPIIIKSLIDIIVVVWAYGQIFNEEKKLNIVFKILLTYLVFFLISSILISLTVSFYDVVTGVLETRSKIGH